MAYFTAVLARSGRTWTAYDLEVDGTTDLTELATDLRKVGDLDEPVLFLVEREDAWWAVVRVDGEDDPRVFVSDVAGVASSTYAELLEVVTDELDNEPEPGTSGGDLDLLSDLGTPMATLKEMCEDEVPPMDALADVAARGGFADELDALR